MRRPFKLNVQVVFFFFYIWSVCETHTPTRGRWTVPVGVWTSPVLVLNSTTTAQMVCRCGFAPLCSALLRSPNKFLVKSTDVGGLGVLKRRLQSMLGRRGAVCMWLELLYECVWKFLCPKVIFMLSRKRPVDGRRWLDSPKEEFFGPVMQKEKLRNSYIWCMTM